MTTAIDRKLQELGLTLPQPAAPVATYVPAVIAGGLLHISGQVSVRDGQLITGRLGDEVGLDHGLDAARQCGLMVIAQAKRALDGDLSRISRIVKLGVFVASSPDFTDQPKVANGASDLMVELFGDAGRHARSAVGVAALPMGVSVEIDAVIEVTGSPLD